MFDKTFKKNISKLLKKWEKNKGKSCYKDSKLMRPILLIILRHYNTIQNTIKWNRFLKVCYLKCLEFRTSATIGISKMECNDKIALRPVKNYDKELNYLKKFKKNLEKIKIKSESTSLSYYNLLPGNKLPLDIRSVIVSFISIVPMKF